MKRGLARRKREDQPTVAGVDGLEPENVAEEGSVRFGVLRIDDYVSPRNHADLQSEDLEILAGSEPGENCKLHPISNRLELDGKFSA
jgi:hypothetical protein